MKNFMFVIGLCALVSNTQAAEKIGGYVGAGGGLGNSQIAKEYGENSYDSIDSKDTSASAYKVFVGYSERAWGAELAYHSFGTFKTEGTYTYYYTYKFSDQFTTTAISAAAIGKAPINQDLIFIGKLGVASATTKYECNQSCTTSSASEKSIVPLLGLGVQYKLSDEFALRAEWEVIGDAKASDGYSSAKYGYNMLSASAQFNF